MNWIPNVLALLVLCLAPITLPAAEPAAPQPVLNNPFFAFDNGTGRGQLSPDEQATMLGELGYAGIGYTGTGNIPEMLAALDRQGLQMFNTYVWAKIGPDGPSYDPGLPEAIKQFKGRNTVIWLTIQGSVPDGTAPDGDAQAVQIVREIGDMAKESGLRVALYPHLGFYVSTVEDGIRIAKKVDRKNVGTSFNLCHWLKEGDEASMERLIEAAMPYLFVVSINGADHEGGWDRLIQTLDRGEFDVYRFLATLKKHSYHGPVGLQCYAVKGDVRENLARSIGAWRKFQERMAAEKPQ